jgi:hypothetical protein
MKGLAVHSRSGKSSAALLALTALCGFAAGALTVGLLASERLGQGSAEPATVPVSYPAPPGAARSAVPPAPAFPLPSAPPPNPWHFEAAAPHPNSGPGRNRPDLLSAPEGWTSEAAKPAERRSSN